MKLQITLTFYKRAERYEDKVEDRVPHTLQYTQTVKLDSSQRQALLAATKELQVQNSSQAIDAANTPRVKDIKIPPLYNLPYKTDSEVVEAKGGSAAHADDLTLELSLERMSYRDSSLSGWVIRAAGGLTLDHTKDCTECTATAECLISRVPAVCESCLAPRWTLSDTCAFGLDGRDQSCWKEPRWGLSLAVFNEQIPAETSWLPLSTVLTVYAFVFLTVSFKFKEFGYKLFKDITLTDMDRTEHIWVIYCTASSYLSHISTSDSDALMLMHC